MTFSPIHPLSVSSEHEFIREDHDSLLDENDYDKYAYSDNFEVDSRSPSFDLQHSSQYSSTIGNIVFHYKSHGGVGTNSKQDSDSVHSSNYTKSVNSQGGIEGLSVK